MKRLLATLLLAGLCTAASAGCPEQIRAFYAAYLSNVLHDSAANDTLCARHLTPELRAKVLRMRNATGADPVIRAQDAAEDAVATLSAEALGDNWYLVKYRWKKDDPTTACEIPVRARTVDGRCRIDFITPPWDGSRYGDDLLRVGDVAPVGSGTPRAFVESFYDNYTALYCSMPEDLDARLAALRGRYLSPQAAAQFARAERENRLDGLDGYDLLIGGFDFDCLWRTTLAAEPLGGDRYRISYRTEGRGPRIDLTLRRDGEGYLIDRINLAQP